MEPFPPPTEEEEEEEDEEEWLHPQPGCGSELPAPSGLSKFVSARSAACRVIVHLDLDCFYAQVEMIRNPELRDKPLGVQQKSIVVTSNYEARKLGVKKLMSVKDAKEKCPQLILVNGEDLTPYREMSYKVTELLGEFCPLVERLGFDENFVDITEIVEKRFNQLQQSGCCSVCVSGHVYNHQAINFHDPTHLRLVIGSQIAQEFREAISTRLGLTGCAGVASNKLMAKLVSGTFKPNQQTLLLPESCQDLLHSLDHIQKVPGIGYKTSQRLEALGVRSVGDLQALPPAVLEKELGVAIAQQIQKLSHGEDDSAVTPSGPPQSFSDEDSFKKCSSEVEVKRKIEELLPNLLDRVSRDGRQPRTVRLTIRQFSSTQRWFHRESRQCPIPPQLLQKFGKEGSDVLSPLVDLLMKLFHKMIDVHLPFHLTLLNVCFSNLRDLPGSKKGSIGFYLKQMSPPPGSGKRLREVDFSPGEGSSSWKQNWEKTGSLKTRQFAEEKQNDIKKAGILGLPFPSAPAENHQDIFREFPEGIEKEILSPKPEVIPAENVSVCCVGEIYSTALNCKGLKRDKGDLTSPHQPGAVLAHSSRATASPGCPRSVQEQAPDSWDFRGRDSGATLEAGANQTHLCVPSQDEDQELPETPQGKTCTQGIVFPPHIDPKTFYELPADVQEELQAEWKNQESGSKIFMDKAPGRKRGRRNPAWSASKRGRRSSAPALAQSNSLLRYFKPQ